jgi:hypothetical protein
MKDILVDNTVAKNFCNPLDPEYKTFIKWIHDEGFLVVTQSLLVEYIATSGAAGANTSMPVLVDRLTREGRLRHFRKPQLAGFRFPRSFRRKLRSNKRDHDNIKAVILSTRKFALSHDKAFRHDVNNYPGYRGRAEIRPQDIPYA